MTSRFVRKVRTSSGAVAVQVVTRDGRQVVEIDHVGSAHSDAELDQVEASFRMTKSDLRARPVFHHQREAIEAHLTIVFAALAISRHLQDATGASIKKIVQTLRTIRSATIEVNGQQLTLEPKIPQHAKDLLDAIKGH